MKRKWTVIAIILLSLISCIGQPEKTAKVKGNTYKKDIMVSFAVNDSLIVIDNNFEIIFINKADSLRPLIKKNKLQLPYLKSDKRYIIVFHYKNYKMLFREITKQMIFSGQNVEWKFGIDDKPFKNNYKGLLSEAEYKNNKRIKAIQYLQFNLLEYGDGIQFVNQIE